MAAGASLLLSLHGSAFQNDYGTRRNLIIERMYRLLHDLLLAGIHYAFPVARFAFLNLESYRFPERIDHHVQVGRAVQTVGQSARLWTEIDQPVRAVPMAASVHGRLFRNAIMC